MCQKRHYDGGAMATTFLDSQHLSHNFKLKKRVGDSESNTKQNDSYNTKNDFSLLLCALLQTCKNIMDGQ